MKNLKINLLAIALVVGISGAFATKIAHMPKATDPTYNWTHYDQSGNPIGTLDNKTVDEARSELGCPGSISVICADAPGAPVDLFYN